MNRYYCKSCNRPILRSELTCPDCLEYAKRKAEIEVARKIYRILRPFGTTKKSIKGKASAWLRLIAFIKENWPEATR